jgi:hypothetical protein
MNGKDQKLKQKRERKINILFNIKRDFSKCE